MWKTNISYEQEKQSLWYYLQFTYKPSIYKPNYLKETTPEKLVFYTYLHNVVLIPNTIYSS